MGDQRMGPANGGQAAIRRDQFRWVGEPIGEGMSIGTSIASLLNIRVAGFARIQVNQGNLNSCESSYKIPTRKTGHD